MTKRRGEDSEAAKIPIKTTKKTKAVPRSGCLKTKKKGTPIKSNRLATSQRWLIFLRSPRKTARAMIKENFENMVDTTFVFLKTVISQTLVHYIKKTDNIFYYYVVNLFHKYQIESLLYQASGETAENKSKLLYDIVKARRWGDFLKPKTVNMIFELYESKNNNMYARRMGVFFRNIRVNIARFTVVWTLSMIHSLLAIGIDAYYTFMESSFSITQSYVPYFIGAGILYSGNLLPGLALMVGSEIITKPLLDYIEEKEVIGRFVIQSKDQAKYLMMIPIVWKMSYLSVIVPPCVHYLNKNFLLNSFMQAITILALLSENNFWHVAFLVMGSLIINNLKYGAKQEDPPKIGIGLIENYLEGSVTEIRRKTEEIILAPESKIVKIEEQASSPQTRANVCKYLSSWIWTSK